jgi:hypothetical protein
VKGDKGDVGATGATGPQGLIGLTGATGPQGPAGADGKTILNGNNDPISSQGIDGDFYINTATSILFGPKANGVWPAGVSLNTSSGGSSGQRMAVFTSSSTFLVPTGVTSVIVELWGGGGGGSQGSVGTRGSWGKQSVSVVPGTSVAVTVGVGGAAAPVRGLSECGGTSFFGDLYARGGRGGNQANCPSGSNAFLACEACIMPPGSLLGFGNGGTSSPTPGIQGVVIVYY